MPASPVVGLVGPNGAGKTAVLEALALLAPGRGLSGGDLQAHAPHGQRQWGTFITMADGTTVGQTYKAGLRTVQLDGTTQPVETLATLGSVVVLTPQTDFLFVGPPEQRRRWLDDAATALQPGHAGLVQRYRQHRQARLKILAQGIMHSDWLEAEERLAAEAGVRLVQGRLAYLAALEPLLVGLSLKLQGGALEIMSAADPVVALQGKFERTRELDVRLGRTHAGPNTLDVAGELLPENQSGPRAGGIALHHTSSGQHKRALLLWLQAHVRMVTAKRKQAPLVLIDEFAAHLDATRREHLLQDLISLGCQVWLADVELPDLAGLQRITLSPTLIAGTE